MKKFFSFCALFVGISCSVTRAFPSEEKQNDTYINLPPLHLQIMGYFRKHNVLPSALDLNQRDGDGNTLLHTAVLCGDYNLLRHLLTLKNINPNVPNNRGSTPLIVAASCDLTAFDFLMSDNRVGNRTQASHNAWCYFNKLRDRVPQSIPISFDDFYR